MTLAVDVSYISTFILSLFSLIGFVICFYIFKTKKKSGHLVCPIDGNCDEVIYSHYSKTFGIRNEIGGMLYYFFTFLVYVSLIIHLKIPLWIIAFSIFSSFVAFLFSIYLIYLQAFIIRKWCTWCVSSAIISTLIFLTSLFNFIV